MKRIFGIRFDHNTVHASVVDRDEEDGSVKILTTCARKVPLTPKERISFEKVENNKEAEDRHARRSSRKNNYRRLLRKRQLIQLLKDHGFIDEDTVLNDGDLKETHRTWKMRAIAPVQKISLEDLARVLLMMSNHRGYKETKGQNDKKEGFIIDGAQTVKEMTRLGMTPGQYVMHLRKTGSQENPKFYPSDLKAELNAIIRMQRAYHPEILDDKTCDILEGCKKKTATSMLSRHTVKTSKKRDEHKKELEQARALAVTGRVEASLLCEIIPTLIGQIDEGSALLGQMSDRSKDAMMAGQTPGQWFWEKMNENGNKFSTKSQPFFRSDYKAEFEVIWNTQAQYHEVLTDELKEEICDHVLFWQRDLKSKKGGYCPFESFKMAIKDPKTGQESYKTVGCRTAPKSSPLFQEFRMMCDIANMTYNRQGETASFSFDAKTKEKIAGALRTSKTMTASAILKTAGLDAKKYELNFESANGNNTIAEIFNTLTAVAKDKGYKDVKKMLAETGACTALLDYDWNLPKEEYERQPLVRLWILVDSYRCDDSHTGMETLKRQIAERFGTDEQTSEALSQMSFATGHGSLSHKAMKRLLPHLKEGSNYYDACVAEGYQISETRSNGTLLQQIPEIGRGQLMNPTAEKIINQVINVMNALIREYGNPDLTVVETPRELNLSNKIKKKILKENKDREAENKAYAEKIRKITGNPNVSSMQILRYRLYEELKENGYRTLYSDRKIELDMLFNTDLIHREHIIPQSVIFDDNYVNYTLEFADVDEDKKDMPARDYVLSRYGQTGLDRYLANVEKLFAKKAISKAKYRYLKMTLGEVPNNILDRQTPARQYAMKEFAKLLSLVSDKVLYTAPAVTRRLTDDWGLSDISTEVNAETYQKAGRVSTDTTSSGKEYKNIYVREYKNASWIKKRWIPTMDPRSGVVDAVVVALTTPSHIAFLNNLAGAKEKGSQFWRLRNALTDFEEGKRLIKSPLPKEELRDKVMELMRRTLVSVKPNGRLVTKKRNVTKTKSNERGRNEHITTVPRGAIHDETVFRKKDVVSEFELNLTGKMQPDDIQYICDEQIRIAVQKRLDEFGGDPLLAFGGKNSLGKKPIWLNTEKTQAVPKKVRCMKTESFYLTRKAINNEINVDKICSQEIKDALVKRIDARGSLKAAVEDMLSNPLIVNGTPVKRVMIKEQSDKLYPIRKKRNARGEMILDNNGNPIPCDYVRPGSNHHAEVFKTPSGELKSRIVSFMECIHRINNGLEPYERHYNEDKGWKYMMHICKGEAMIFPIIEKEFFPSRMTVEQLESSPYTSSALYYLQKMSDQELLFRHHSDNNVTLDLELSNIKIKRMTDAKGLSGAVKVRLNHIGQIEEIVCSL